MCKRCQHMSSRLLQLHSAQDHGGVVLECRRYATTDVLSAGQGPRGGKHQSVHCYQSLCFATYQQLTYLYSRHINIAGHVDAAALLLLTSKIKVVQPMSAIPLCIVNAGVRPTRTPAASHCLLCQAQSTSANTRDHRWRGCPLLADSI